MMMKSIWVSVVCAAFSVTTFADVRLQFSPTTVPVNQQTEIELSLLVNDGLDSTIGAIIMDFDEGIGLSAINPIDFEFDDALTTADWFWEATLPSSIQTVWAGSAGFGPGIVGGQSIIIGTMTVDPKAMGNWSLTSNLEVNNSLDFEAFDIKSGDPTVISVVPEPASLCLLALGAVAAFRRRRR